MLDFEFALQTRALIDRLPFTYLHVFTYSERPGTPAAESPDSVPMRVRKERNRVLRELAAAKNRAFRERLVGETLAAVTLNEPGAALTSNYLKVEMSKPREANLLVDLRICGLSESGLRESD